jgi:ATP-dependent DNA helicase RecQ
MTTPLDILKTTFGFDAFRPLQEKIIKSVLAGRDNFVLMPTGGGKSLCFQIPALILPGTTIVVSPLISLMQDQVDALRANGVKAAFYNSSLSYPESQAVLKDLENDNLSLLYVAPETLMREDFLERIAELTISLIAVDEVHCVSQWGHQFRPEYAQLASLRPLFPTVPWLVLTATADKQTRDDIKQILSLHNADFHLASFNRPNISYTIKEKHQPQEQLKAFLENRQDESGIIYCLSRKRVEEIANTLKEAGFNASPYHAGLSSDLRRETQTAFQRDDIKIVVATIAFGMGIDKPNVRFVFHYDMPKNIEGYYQETGRAGRDGLPADAFLLFGLRDIVMVKSLIETNHDNPEQCRIELHKLNAMTGLCEAQTCRRRVLLQYFHETLPEDCNNCDVCRDPPTVYDATEDVQKALSCVYRVGQRFGVAHVIDILRGSQSEKIKSYGHETLSTYGIGKHHSQPVWHSLFRQMIHYGLLEQDIAAYSILKLTEKSRPILKNETTISLAIPKIKPKKEKPKKQKKSKSARLNTDIDYDHDLFERLRTLRRQLAQEANMPPYIVFSDASLIEMAAFKPTSKTDFSKINGVGDAKLERYGDAFIAECML